ncbi:MAG: hypothetical protein H6710_23730 [Myxococcales bacterium]|nr:hypothetical protein [Myxococcales bacterium]MCB9700796.1 hypothetical protein [Myxococcales bacterium]
MQFYNKVPMGELDARSRTDKEVLYFTSIKVRVYDQDDFFGGNDWRFGVTGIPRWEHTFTAKGDVTYKPGGGKRYKARVTGSYVIRKRTSETTWGPEEKGDTDEFIEHLEDDGQWIAIEPYPYNPHNIEVKAGLDGPAPSLFAGGGTLYLVNGDGNLVRYTHDAAGTFENYSGQVIGWGWGGLRSIHAVRDGGVYTIAADGTLRYYHHNGAGTWDDINGKVIGSGWAGFPWVGAGRFGQLYAITSDGKLLYYQHDGNLAWQLTGVEIGNGWPTTGVFAGGANCLYIVNGSGELLYYYHDDARIWKVTGLKIGVGWGGFSSLASSGNGEIYGVLPNGNLLFYRHDVNKKFIAGSSRVIGWGWGVGKHGLLASAR